MAKKKAAKDPVEFKETFKEVVPNATPYPEYWDGTQWKNLSSSLTLSGAVTSASTALPGTVATSLNMVQNLSGNSLLLNWPTSGDVSVNSFLGINTNLSSKARRDYVWSSAYLSATRRNYVFVTQQPTGTNTSVDNQRGQYSIGFGDNFGAGDRAIPFSITTNQAFTDISLTLTGNTTLNGSLTVSGNTTLGSDLSVGGAAAITGATMLKSGLSVQGITYLYDQVTVGTQGTPSRLSVNGTFLVTDNAGFASTVFTDYINSYSGDKIVFSSWVSIETYSTAQYNRYAYLTLNGRDKWETGEGNGPGYYSLRCLGRVQAGEFNATSSIEKKNVKAKAEDVESEVLNIFKQMPLFKYDLKDPIRDGYGDRYGLVAEELAKVLPQAVNPAWQFVPNIMQKCKIEKNGLLFELHFEKDLPDFKGNQIEVLFLEDPLTAKDICESTSQEEGQKVVFDIKDKGVNYLICSLASTESKKPVISEGRLYFARGTYEYCPTVAKDQVFEIALVVLQNVVKRLEKLEQNTNFKEG